MIPHLVLCLDFDGVILESVTVKDDAYRNLFSGIADAVRDRVLAAHRATPGVPRPVKVRRLYQLAFGHPPAEAEADALVARYAALVEQGMAESAEVPGVMAMVRAAPVPVHVVTAAPEDEVREIIAKRGWSPLFRSVLGSPRAKGDLLREVGAREAVAAADILFIGDRPNDLAAAREAGCAFLGRVPPGAASPFPSDIAVIADFSDWGAA